MKRLIILVAVVFGMLSSDESQAQFLDSNLVWVSGTIINAPPQLPITITYDGINQVTVSAINGNFSFVFQPNNIQGIVNITYTDCNNVAYTIGQPFLVPPDDYLYFEISYCGGGTGTLGCTDSTALNYNPLATIDNGSCIYDTTFFYGCTDPNANNYNPWATIDDGSCWYDSTFFYGCTNPLAQNYNPLATIDDGSCIVACDPGQVIAELYVCTFQNGPLVGIEVIGDNGDTVFTQFGFNNLEIAYFDICLDDSVCYTVNMYNSNGFGWYNGYYWINVNGIQVSTNFLDANLNFESVTFSIDGTCGEIYGCTDPNANNYNSLATIDDGSCWYDSTFFYGCTDPFALNYDPWANIDDGSCIYDSLIFGCTDPQANNYDPWATIDDGSCLYDSCNENLINVEFISELWGNEITWEIINTNLNTIEATGGPYVNNSVDYSTICLEDGCYHINMYDSFGDGWNGGSITLSGNGLIYLNTTLSSGNYGTVPFGINDNLCDSLWVVTGCTDPFAVNYNPWATVDDGSCYYDTLIYGCTDPYAYNYNPLATIDDGSCYYDTTCFAYFEIVEVDSILNVVYLVNLSTSGPQTTYLWDFGDGTTSSDPYPTHVYAQDGLYWVCLTIVDFFDPLGNIPCTSTYCDTVGFYAIQGGGQLESFNGFTINVLAPPATGIEELGSNDFVLYPNPNVGGFYIKLAGKTLAEVNWQIYDMTGKSVDRGQWINLGNDAQYIDINYVESGLYHLEIIAGDQRIMKKITVLK